MISIVIPLYNKKNTIKNTLETVLSQTFTDFEVIVINDGSTDDGVSVIKNNFSEKRIKIFHQDNQGVSVARNRGVMEAKFEYVAFLDADDAWMPNFLFKIKEAIDKFPDAGLLGTTSLHIDYVTGEKYDSTLDRYKGKILKIEYFENPGIAPHTSATVIKKKVFNAVDLNGHGFPVGMKCCEDWSCFYRMAFLAPVVYIGEPLGIRYNNVPGQITGLSDEAARFKLLTHVTDFYNLIFKTCEKENPNYRLFLINLNYDLRHRMIDALRKKDYKTIDYFLTHLDKSILQLFHKFEISIYTKQWMNLPAIGYIYFTKILWRRHNFPIVGRSK